jgi:hypothetical protein
VLKSSESISVYDLRGNSRILILPLFRKFSKKKSSRKFPHSHNEVLFAKHNEIVCIGFRSCPSILRNYPLTDKLTIIDSCMAFSLFLYRNSACHTIIMVRVQNRIGSTEGPSRGRQPAVARIKLI